LLLLLHLPGSPAAAQQPPRYRALLGAHYESALDYLASRSTSLIATLRNAGQDPDLLVPVVFPELVRYSIIRDRIEITGLKVFYVYLGGEFADFSIGRFQMKPSFVEELEKAVRRYRLRAFFELLDYGDTRDEREIRRARVARLEQEFWQERYLACFGAVLTRRFPHEQAMKPEERIEFAAAAYNRGFWKSEGDIRQSAQRALFPYGTEYPGLQYRYSDVAVGFYLHEWPEMTRSCMPVQPGRSLRVSEIPHRPDSPRRER
jgi:hypothetical protein